MAVRFLIIFRDDGRDAGGLKDEKIFVLDFHHFVPGLSDEDGISGE